RPSMRAEQYRQECWRLAQMIPPNARARLLELAHVWQHLVDEQRGVAAGVPTPRQAPPSLPLAQQSTGVYMPPPVSNPSAQINQLNQSFQFNRGLGNNPTGRDSFIRYNLTR